MDLSGSAESQDRLQDLQVGGVSYNLGRPPCSSAETGGRRQLRACSDLPECALPRTLRHAS
jgi:hypothetical protein